MSTWPLMIARSGNDHVRPSTLAMIGKQWEGAA